MDSEENHQQKREIHYPRHIRIHEQIGDELTLRTDTSRPVCGNDWNLEGGGTRSVDREIDASTSYRQIP